MPNWHPDFRNTALLPDIKAVRTDFIVNILSVVVPLALAIFFFYQEWERFSTRGEIAALRESVEAGSRTSERFIKLDQTFFKEAARLREVNQFFRQPAAPLEVVTALTELRPEGFAYSSIGYKESLEPLPGKKKGERLVGMVSVQGNVQGSSLEVFTQMAEFERAVQQMPLFAGRIVEFQPNSNFNPDSELLQFSIQLKITMEEEQ